MKAGGLVKTGDAMRSRSIPFILALSGLSALAAPATAEIRFLAYDARDRVTQTLTRGVTLEVERGLFGAMSVQRLFSTSARGSAEFRRGGPDAVKRALPEGAQESAVYSILAEGDGRGLTRALCPGAEEAWVVTGRVRAVRPLTLQAVGRWPDGQFRHCVTLNYDYRGEWATPPGAAPVDPSPMQTGPG